MSIELELFDPEKHENPRNEINSELQELDCDFQFSLPLGWYKRDGTYRIIIGRVKEEGAYRILNHEIIHCVLGIIGEDPNEKYNRVHYYVDWVHAGLETIDGKELWDKIIASRTECPRCGGVAETVGDESEIYQCVKCMFLYDEEHKKGWIELSESDVWEKYDIDPGYFKKM